MEKIHIEKGSVQETLIAPLYARKLCAEQSSMRQVFFIISQRIRSGRWCLPWQIISRAEGWCSTP